MHSYWSKTHVHDPLLRPGLRCSRPASGGDAHLPQSQGTEETRRGSLSWVSHLGIGYFSGPASSGLEPYYEVKCSQWVQFPATILY